jgi:hypothetical protein
MDFQQWFSLKKLETAANLQFGFRLSGYQSNIAKSSTEQSGSVGQLLQVGADPIDGWKLRG